MITNSSTSYHIVLHTLLEKNINRQKNVKQKIFSATSPLSLSTAYTLTLFNSDITLKVKSIRSIGSIKFFEQTFLSDTKGKWLLVTTKKPRKQEHKYYSMIFSKTGQYSYQSTSYQVEFQN